MDCERNLFDRFGGVRPMAEAMLEPPSTVQSWKTAGRIPATKQPFVLEKAGELGLDIHPIDIIFPLRLRTDAAPRPAVSASASETAVKAGASTGHFARGAGMKGGTSA